MQDHMEIGRTLRGAHSWSSSQNMQILLDSLEERGAANFCRAQQRCDARGSHQCPDRTGCSAPHSTMQSFSTPSEMTRRCCLSPARRNVCMRQTQTATSAPAVMLYREHPELLLCARLTGKYTDCRTCGILQSYEGDKTRTSQPS